MTARIMISSRRTEDGPRLVLDLDVVRANYLVLARALLDTRVFYAVKANPAPEVLNLLTALGSCSMSPPWARSSWCCRRVPA